uniref:methylmalonyl-CoA mutase family protein n=1 Tax=Nocardiopsis alkaliphila TaxID=225762 RepID=UPI0005264CEB
ALEKGDKRIVGVNCHTNTVSGELDILKISHEVEHEQKRVLSDRKAARDQAEVERSLTRLLEAVRANEGNLIPIIMDAARAEATLGEICATMGEEFGTYTEDPQF